MNKPVSLMFSSDVFQASMAAYENTIQQSAGASFNTQTVIEDPNNIELSVLGDNIKRREDLKVRLIDFLNLADSAEIPYSAGNLVYTDGSSSTSSISKDIYLSAYSFLNTVIPSEDLVMFDVDADGTKYIIGELLTIPAYEEGKLAVTNYDLIQTGSPAFTHISSDSEYYSFCREEILGGLFDTCYGNLYTRDMYENDDGIRARIDRDIYVIDTNIRRDILNNIIPSIYITMSGAENGLSEETLKRFMH